MKKAIKFMLLPLLIFVCSFCLIACGGSGNGRNDDDSDVGKISLSSKMFDGYQVNLGNANSLGIVNSDKNILVGIDEAQNFTEIEFEKEFNKIKQKEINAQIDKLYITNDYIFFTLTKDVINRTEEEDYDQTSYRCDVATQSFLIDRATKNIYSLARFPYISRIQDNIISLRPSFYSETYYKITIEQNQLVFTDIGPSVVLNENISISAVDIDKHGIIFVQNNTVEQIEGNVFYYKPLINYLWFRNFYGLGTDGNFYHCSVKYSDDSYLSTTDGYIRWFNPQIMDWDVPQFDEPIWLKFPTAMNEDSFYIKDDFVYFGKGRGQQSYLTDLFISEFTVGTDRITMTNASKDVYNAAYDIPRTYIIDNQLFRVPHRSMPQKVYFLDTSSRAGIQAGYRLVEEGFDSIIFDGTNLIGSIELLTKTQKFRIYFDGENPVCELHEDIIYETVIVIIKPLNGVD